MPEISGWWYGAVAALLLALAAGVADWRHKRRRDPDTVGLVSWPTVQALALITTAACAMLAWHG